MWLKITYKDNSTYHNKYTIGIYEYTDSSGDIWITPKSTTVMWINEYLDKGDSVCQDPNRKSIKILNKDEVMVECL